MMTTLAFIRSISFIYNVPTIAESTGVVGPGQMVQLHNLQHFQLQFRGLRNKKQSVKIGIVAGLVFLFLILRPSRQPTSPTASGVQNQPRPHPVPHDVMRSEKLEGSLSDEDGSVDDDDYLAGLTSQVDHSAVRQQHRSSGSNPGDDSSGSGSHEDDDYIEDWESKGEAADLDSGSSTRTGGAEGEDGSPRFEPGTPFLRALSTCDTLECVRDAHALQKPPGTFNFPEFLITGFQKAATTSLYGHLSLHPQIIKPAGKEPEFLSFTCHYNPPFECPAASSKKYLHTTLHLQDYINAGGKLSTFEASTHLVRNGDVLAPRLRAVMPWLKHVILMREPISRAASMLIHLKDVSKEGCLMTRKLGDCLLTESQISGAPSGARTTNYSSPIKAWLDEWPAEQLYIIQYEQLIEEGHETEVLSGLKRFLGVKPGVPAMKLGIHNSRKYKIRPKGWKMRRETYEALVDLVRPDVDALLDVLEEHDKGGSRAAWLRRWQQVWEDNLGSCDDAGICNILLS